MYSWVADKNAGLDIIASRMDADTDDITGNGLSAVLTRDGQGSATAALPMNGYNHTGVGVGTANNHYATVGQVQDSGPFFAVGAGTADALTANFSPAITVLVDGMQLTIRALYANATTTPTLVVNGLTAYTITKNGGAALVAGDIAALKPIIVQYVLATTTWELLNPVASPPVTITLTGDVTGTGTGTFATTITNTNAKNAGTMAARNVTIQSGGSPSGGSNGDCFFIY